MLTRPHTGPGNVPRGCGYMQGGEGEGDGRGQRRGVASGDGRTGGAGPRSGVARCLWSAQQGPASPMAPAGGRARTTRACRAVLALCGGRPRALRLLLRPTAAPPKSPESPPGSLQQQRRPNPSSLPPHPRPRSRPRRSDARASSSPGTYMSGIRTMGSSLVSNFIKGPAGSLQVRHGGPHGAAQQHRRGQGVAPPCDAPCVQV